MVIAIANLIKEYAEIDDLPPEKYFVAYLNRVNAAIMKCFINLDIDWEQVPQMKEGHRSAVGSTSRRVYLCEKLGIAVKISGCVYNFDSGKPKFPCSEKLAGDICALFGWSEMPKTTIIHETEKNRPKYSDYQPLMDCFSTDYSKEGFPTTFIFQDMVRGSSLPFEVEQWHEWDKEQHKTSLPSYQRAFLLVLMLGKHDAAGHNSMHDPETGRFYEIDNEAIGIGINQTDKGFYEVEGTLHHFGSLKLEPLDKEVQEVFLKVKPADLWYLIEKSKRENMRLAALWAKERYAKTYRDLPNTLASVQSNIYSRFISMQWICRDLIKNDLPVTIKQIEDALEKECKMHERLEKQRALLDYENQIYLQKYLKKTQTKLPA